MANFVKGQKVTQVVAPIQGTVEGFQVDQETGELQVLVGWVDGNGESHARYFSETDLAATA